MAGSGVRSSSRRPTARRARSLIARCYSDYDKSPELASEADDIAERLGDPSLRSHSYDVLSLTAFAANDYEGASKWSRRRVSLVDEIDDPDHQQDIYYIAFGPAVACGDFDEARGHAMSHEEITAGSHRIIGCTAFPPP